MVKMVGFRDAFGGMSNLQNSILVMEILCVYVYKVHTLIKFLCKNFEF